MLEAKKKKQQFSAEYVKYGFIENPANSSSPICLICQKTLSIKAMKPSRLQDHLNKMHPDKKESLNSSFALDLVKMFLFNLNKSLICG